MIADIIPKVAAATAEQEHEFYPRPSMAGPSRCLRQMVYHGLKVPREPWPGRMLLVFDDGTWHEELTADWIRKTAFTLHSQQMVVDCPEPMKSGSIDGIVTTLNGTDILWEHKAINHFTFQRYWGGNEFPEDYLAQCAIYIQSLQTENPNLADANLLIKNKNTAQYMEYYLRYDPPADTLHILWKMGSAGDKIEINEQRENIVADACAKFNETLDLIAKKTLPPRPYDIDDWHCEYCGWGKACWDGYAKEFEELKTDELLPTDVADIIRYRAELAAHRRDIEKDERQLADEIKGILKKAEARKGVAGEYVCELKLQTRRSVDHSKVPAQYLEPATKTSQYERLFIRKASTK